VVENHQESPIPSTPAAATNPAVEEALAAASIPHLVDPDLPVHEAATILLEIDGEEYEEVKRDIQENGQRVAAWTFQGELIEGRTRQKICKELGRQLLVQEWAGGDSVFAFVASLNVYRRHLKTSQRAMVAAKLKEKFEEESKRRMHHGRAADPVENSPQGTARDQAAKVLKVSGRIVQDADTVRKRGVKELNEAVERGQIAVSAAAEIAELPPAKQQQLIAKGPKKLKRAATKLRKAKKQTAAGKKPARTGKVPTTQHTVTISRPEDDKGVAAVSETLWTILGERFCNIIQQDWARRSAASMPKKPTSKKPAPKKPAPKKPTPKKPAPKAGGKHGAGGKQRPNGSAKAKTLFE